MTLLVPLIFSALAAAEPASIAFRVDVHPRGAGTNGTVVEIILTVAPEETDLASSRVGLVLVANQEGGAIDRLETSVVLEGGSARLYREWPPGSLELQVSVRDTDRSRGGLWIDQIEVPTLAEPFRAAEDAPPEAVALEPAVSIQGKIKFRPPGKPGGLGGLSLELDVPEGTARVEFAKDGEAILLRRRPPWRVSIPLGQVVRKTTIRATAWDSSGRLLGEDAIVLNVPSGRLAVEILISPQAGERTITVAVSGPKQPTSIDLHLDDRQIGRWEACPCVARISDSELARARVLSAGAESADGTRGDAVLILGVGAIAEQVEVEVVEVPVLVLDSNGRPIADLTRESFSLFENDSAVPLDGFGTTRDLTLSLGIAIDTSGSMEQTFPEVQDAVLGFARELMGKKDEAFLLSFAWDAEIEVAWTARPSDLGIAVHSLKAEGGTSLRDGLVRALERFRGRRGRQALVLLSDGEDTVSRTDWNVALRFARTMRVPIFPIGFQISRLDFGVRRQLVQLAETTGGQAFFPASTAELVDVYKQIDELLRSQYLLSYRASGEDPDLYREITVKVDRPGAKVRTISGYYPGG